MTSNHTKSPTDAELAILNVLWRIGPATVRQVHESLPDALRRGYTTTLKLMQIMTEKGVVERDESHRSHVYAAAAGEREMKDRLVGDLVDKAFEGSAAKLAMRALAHKPTSPQELDEVRKLLDQLESNGEIAMSSVIGWSLVHFLWQGALIALLLEAVLGALQNRSAELRYTVRCVALGAMALAPVITFAVLAAAPQAALPREALLAAVLAGIEPARAPVWTDAVTLVWSLGASFFAARLLRDWLRVRRLQSSDAGGLLPLTWQVRFDDIAELLQVRAVARVVDSASLAAPTVIGWMKPVVLVPARVLTGLSQDQVEALLAHELAHVRRHDYLVNLVQSAVEALLFYHPAVWWVSNGIRAEREFCCDDVALRVTHNRLSYARALTTLEGWRGAELEIAMSTLGGPLMQRIQRMVGVRQSNSLVRGPLAALAALLVLGCATSAFGHDPATPQDAEVRELQAEIEAMESRLAELKVQLAKTKHEYADGNVWVSEHGNEGGIWVEEHADGKDNVWVEKIHAGDDDVRVFHKGDNEVYELKSSGDAGNKQVWHFEGDNARGKIVVEVHGAEVSEDVHEHVHEALKSHGVFLESSPRKGRKNVFLKTAPRKGHAVGIGSSEGEGEVIIEIRGDDGEADVIKKRVRIGGVHGGGGNVVIDLEDIEDLEQLHEHHNQLKAHTSHGSGNVWLNDGGDDELMILREQVHAARKDAERAHQHASGEHARMLELHGNSQADVEKLHEHLKHVEEADMAKLHEHLQRIGEIDVEQLHEHIQKAVEVHGIQGHNGNVRVLKLDELGELMELKELQGLQELHLEELHELGELKKLHRLETLHGASSGGKVRVLRLDGDVKLDIHDDLLEKVHKARIELRREHEGDAERQEKKKAKSNRIVRANDKKIV